MAGSHSGAAPIKGLVGLPWFEGVTSALPVCTLGGAQSLGGFLPAGATCINSQQGSFFPGLEHTTGSARFRCSLETAADVTHSGFWSFFNKGGSVKKKKKGTCLVGTY